jgi:diguanylate cyclase (GGDEF)-like protein
MRLQSKILSVLVPLVLLPLIAIGAVAYHQLRATAEESRLAQMTSLLEQSILHARSRIGTAETNAALFASHSLVEHYLQTDDATERYGLLQPALLRQLVHYQRAYPDYLEFAVLLADGMTDAEVGVAPQASVPPISVSRPDPGAEQSSQVLATPGAPSLIVAQRVMLKDPGLDPVMATPRLRGYLTLRLDLSFLRAQVRNRIGNAGYLFVTGGDGRILLHPQGAQEGAWLPGALHATLMQAEHPRLLDAPEGAVYALARVIHPGLQLIAVLPERELTSVSQALALKVAAITLAAILLITLLLYAVLRRLLVRPIQALSRAAQAIGQGELHVPMPVAGDDELGALAQTLQEMSSNLAHSQQQVYYHAYHDSLTALPNRMAFRTHLTQVLANARRNHEKAALLFLDLDDFKHINDTLGHQAGDRLLRELAERLARCLREGDYLALGDDREGQMVARLGGDEFIILLPHINEPLQAGQVAERMLASLSEPYLVGEERFHLGASIGITVFPQDGADVDTLIKHADLAMYHAKAQGKHNYQFYSASVHQALRDRFDLENGLRRALQSEEFLLHYQPIVDSASGRIVALEALVRWQDPGRGLLGPDQFIAVAEQSKLIVALGEWVLDNACRQQRVWRDLGIVTPPVCVNISAVQLARSELAQTIAGTLANAGIEAGRLHIEITETCLVAEQAVAQLDAISRLGVEISLDDFGVGYSSLSHLRRFPLDCVKIDKSFVRDVTTDSDDDAIIKAIIAMAHTLNLKVVAEGVERPGQAELLRAHGCDCLQGFWIQRPVPAADVPRLLAAAPRMAAGLAQPADRGM